MKTAKNHNATMMLERLFEALGCKFVTVTPPPDFTAKVMRRIRKARKASK
jgi:hypothetical protein